MNKLKRGFKTILGFASAFLLICISYMLYCNGKFAVTDILVVGILSIETIQLIVDIVRGKEL